jgi:hypothetical protein
VPDPERTLAAAIFGKLNARTDEIVATATARADGSK